MQSNQEYVYSHTSVFEGSSIALGKDALLSTIMAQPLSQISIADFGDSTAFVIDQASGALTFKYSPDYEKPGDLNHDNIYDIAINVGSGENFATKYLSVTIVDRKDLQVTLSLGQSLSVGTTTNPVVFSSKPDIQAQAYSLDFGRPLYFSRGWGAEAVDPTRFKGIAPIYEFGFETHASAMLSQIAQQYLEAGLEAPTLVHINAGAGGQSIVRLMLSKENIFDTVDKGLSLTSSGDLFAIQRSNGVLDYYVNFAKGAQFLYSFDGTPSFYSNLISQISLLADYTKSNGMEIAPKILLNWIQGQGDTGIPAGIYKHLLGELFQSIEEDLAGFGIQDMQVLGLVSQTRGFAQKSVSIEQLEFVRENAKVALGITEYAYQASYGDPTANRYTHLTSEGYYKLGQDLGVRAFDLLTNHEKLPIVFERFSWETNTSLIVDFSNVTGHLVDDVNLYDVANRLIAPKNFGFSLYSEQGYRLPSYSIVSTDIVDQDSVRLTFNQPISQLVRLYIGRSEDEVATPGSGFSLAGFGGTTLRDSTVERATAPNSNRSLQDVNIYNFIPIQYMNLNPIIFPNLMQSVIQVNENSDILINLNNYLSPSIKKEGLYFNIIDQGAGTIFSIDPAKGLLWFTKTPDFERDKPANELINELTHGIGHFALTIQLTSPFGVTVSQIITIQLNDLNEAPIFSNFILTPLGLNPNNDDIVASFNVTDPDY